MDRKYFSEDTRVHGVVRVHKANCALYSHCAPNQTEDYFRILTSTLLKPNILKRRPFYWLQHWSTDRLHNKCDYNTEETYILPG